MATAKQILDIARAEIGYKEGANNSNKYGSLYGLNNQPWCVIFIWWIFHQANASKLFYGGNRIALCSALFNFHKSQAVSRSALKPGDIVFFDFSGRGVDTSHVGIVESVSGTSIITIEGNTSSGSSGSQSNGDGVYRRTRSLSLVSKAYRPAYDNADAMKKCTVELPELKKGCTGEAVSTLQILLRVKGFDPQGVDADLGGNTEKALIAFQEKNGLEADGICGKNTWTKLIGG